MHVITGLLILILALGALYYLGQAGFFEPITDIFRGLGGVYGDGEEARSEHLNELRIRFVSLGSDINPSTVVLTTNLKDKEGITVSGWKLKTDLGSYVIPQAENRYSPTAPGALPEDIYIRDGGIIRIYSGEGPNVRTAFNEWELHAGDALLEIPHGEITLFDDKGKQVDRYEY